MNSLRVTWLKRADTVLLRVMVRLQVVVVPRQAPPQEPKVKPVPAVAVSATGVPESNVAMQVPGQLMPFGPVTVPPDGGVTVSRTGGGGPNVAETVRLPAIVTMQVEPAAVPAQASPQRSWTLPGPATAFSGS